MQLAHQFRDSSVSTRSSRLLAFATELPPETQSVSDAKPETKLTIPQAESDARQSKVREQRDNRNRRETWERACEQMTDEQLLQTLGELHVKSEDTYEKLDSVNSANPSARAQALSRQVEFIEEQLAGARQVWMERKHAKQPAAEWTKEVAALETQLATSREQFEQQPKTSPRYSEERLKLAILEEQTHVAESAKPLVKKN